MGSSPVLLEGGMCFDWGTGEGSPGTDFLTKQVATCTLHSGERGLRPPEVLALRGLEGA